LSGVAGAAQSWAVHQKFSQKNELILPLGSLYRITAHYLGRHLFRSYATHCRAVRWWAVWLRHHCCHCLSCLRFICCGKGGGLNKDLL